MESLVNSQVEVMDSQTSKNDKLRVSFKESKKKVKAWEEEFFAAHERKPNKDEMKAAPDNVQTAYKNCYKIKAYFAKSEHASEVFNEDSQTVDTTGNTNSKKSDATQTSFSGVLSTTSTLPAEIPCADISNLGSVWGKHLNHKPRKTASLSSYDNLSSKLGLQLSQVTSNSTRTSLKKRKKAFKSFSDTLGDSSINDLTLDNSMLGPVVSSPAPPPPTSLPTRSSSPEPDQLFPSLVTGKVVTGPAKVTSTTVKTQRKVDASWLERCSGVVSDKPAGVDGEQLAGGVNNKPNGVDSEQIAGVMKDEPAVVVGEVPAMKSGYQTEPVQPKTVEPVAAPVVQRVVEGVVESEVVGRKISAVESFNKDDKKRKRQSENSEEDYDGQGVDGNDGESDDNTETDAKPKKKVESKAGKKAAKPKKKKVKKIESSDEEDCGITEVMEGPSNIPQVGLNREGKIKSYKEDKEVVLDAKERADQIIADALGEDSDHDPEYNPKDDKEDDEDMARTQRLLALCRTYSPDNKKRKRQSESEEEDHDREGVDGIDYESDNNTETEMDAKPMKKAASKADKKAAKPRKKKVKKAESSDEEDGGITAVVDGPSDLNLYALGFEEGDATKKQAVRKVQTAQERLETKVNSGKAGDNFLKIDIKKKSYSRGKGGSSGEMIKRAEWKRKNDMKEGKKVKEFKCYRCGELGHFSRQCTGGKGDALIPTEMADEFDPGEFPTLEQAQEMATGVVKVDNSKVTRLFTVKEKEEGEEVATNLDFEAVDDALLLEAAMQYECAPMEDASVKFAVPALISSFDEDRQFVYSALARWGYEQFREGQEEAIMRILAGQSSLVLLATGTGKSLIYQLPALLYREKSNCITLVVSPLVSLMEDQVTGLPPFLKAAALHYNMTASQKEKVVEQVKSGKLHFLLVSPEAVAGGGGAFGALLPNLPPIAFVCIDEAHCVSHWSHNFRPSYLRLSKIIREKLGVKTILGLTATAPESLTRSVAEHLGVAEDGVIRGPLLPGNLTMTVSNDAERDKALLFMLTEGSLAECDSVIIYCTRRDVCERLATVVRTQLQARDIKLAERRERKTRVSATAEPYHAGLSSFRRKTVQNHFMSGKLRIVIATVAFGMGIDKSDIRAIVHYNMPRTFESYIQEIGRAGRDGEPARGHLFLDSKGGDLTELKRHIFANSMDRHTLRKLLHAVFPHSITEESGGRKTDYQEMAMSVESMVEKLDLPEENISTLLCYLENYSPPYIKLSNPVYCMAKVQCYGGPRQLRQVAAKSPPLAAAIAILRQGGQQDIKSASSVEFQVVEVSARMGWQSAIVKKDLKNLEWTSTPTGWKKTGVLVEFSDLAFHFSAATGLEEDQLDQLLEELYTRVENREKTELWGLTRLAKAFKTVSYSKQVEGGEEEDKEKSDKLKVFIREYFEEPERHVPEVLAPPPPCQHEGQVRADIRAFVGQHQEHDWTGRAVARVLHGIQSPNYPAKQWGRVFRSWRSHLDTDFNLLVQFAKEEILSMRRG